MTDINSLNTKTKTVHDTWLAAAGVCERIMEDCLRDHDQQGAFACETIRNLCLWEARNT